MWSTAFGLVALAVVLFVATYAALHTPTLATVNIADQLYAAKTALNMLDALNAYANYSAFQNATPNAVLVKDVVVCPPGLGKPLAVAVPVGYKLSSEGRNVRYQLYVHLVSCRNVTTPWGEPAALYEVELIHSLDILPWLDVVAVPVENLTQYLLSINYGAPLLGRLSAYPAAKAQWAMVYDGNVTKLYIVAPQSTPLIYIVDYPLRLPLACPEVIQRLFSC